MSALPPSLEDGRPFDKERVLAWLSADELDGCCWEGGSRGRSYPASQRSFWGVSISRMFFVAWGPNFMAKAEVRLPWRSNTGNPALLMGWR